MEAAARLILDNHPGAAPELQDELVIGAVHKALAAGRYAALGVTDFNGYARVMLDFAQAQADPHIAWQPTTAAPLKPSILPRPTSSPNLRVDDEQVTIVLPTFDNRARALVRSIVRDPREVLRATTVKIDVRGNSGGDSSIGDELIVSLYGNSALSGIRAAYPACPVLWRASPANLAALAQLAEQLAGHSPSRATALREEVERGLRARKLGRDFADSLSAACRNPMKPALAKQPPSRRVVIVTDAACFSSCLLFVERLKALGARQVGQATRAGNWYMEARPELLPSGLATFSTLQKVDLRRSRTIGPFTPDP